MHANRYTIQAELARALLFRKRTSGFAISENPAQELCIKMRSGGHMKKHCIKIAILLCVGVVLLGALFLQTVGAKAAATSSGKISQNVLSSQFCALGKWSVVPSPNPNGPGNLNAVAAVSAHDIWAVGGFNNQATGAQQTLIEHWNGTIWQIVASPNPSATY